MWSGLLESNSYAFQKTRVWGQSLYELRATTSFVERLRKADLDRGIHRLVIHLNHGRRVMDPDHNMAGGSGCMPSCMVRTEESRVGRM